MEKDKILRILFSNAYVDNLEGGVSIHESKFQIVANEIIKGINTKPKEGKE